MGGGLAAPTIVEEESGQRTEMVRKPSKRWSVQKNSTRPIDLPYDCLLALLLGHCALLSVFT